ncbi:cory-CC-star protein [Brachybacterium squillarum]|uniref:cory-CC-star protein n=1 Tax=Brachybacterium squillarum TaxID=661979 RepID=UPI000493B7EA|nr:cory-CC-star protein [Brachybacterium squillarum]
MSAGGRWAALREGMHEFYVAPYRRTFARARREQEDLFRLLVMGEMLGVPSPAAALTPELLPLMLDEFHDWHRRMGMERSPLEGVGCC